MSRKLYLSLNEPGSGEITLPLDTAQAANIASGSWVDLDYKGVNLGGFWAENFTRVKANSQEGAGRVLRVTGRGALAILDDAIVWDWMTPLDQNIRFFFAPPDESVAPMYKKGIIFNQLLNEAMYSQTNFSGDTMDRQCWHDAAGNHLLAWGFDGTNDSDGVPWDAAETGLIQVRVGTSLLDLARQFAELGQPTAGLEFNIKAVHGSDGVTTVYINQTPIGRTQAQAETHFRVGHNCLEVSDTEGRADLRNALLVESGDSGEPYSNTEDATSITGYRRREMLLQASNASDAAMATIFGDAQLVSLKDPKRAIAIKITDAANIKYGTHYNLGDWVYYDDGTGSEVLYRIKGIQLEWDDDWFADVVVELSSSFMEDEIRSARDLRKLGAQASGSSLMTPGGAKAVVMSILTNVPAGLATKGQVLTADGLGYADWESVDGGSQSPGGTEHLISLLHLDGDDLSTTITDELPNTWTAYSGAKLTTSIYKFASACGSFDGTNDYMGTADIPASGTSDFTRECWIYPTALPAASGSRPIFSSNGATWYGSGVIVSINENGKITLHAPNGMDTDQPRIITAMSVSLNTWHHIALVRQSNVFKIYIDGKKDVNTHTQNQNNTPTTMLLGQGVIYTFGPTVYYYQGYIDEFAAWNYAKYTANFIPLTLPYTIASQIERDTTIQFRRGAAANLPPLFSGEPFIETDTGLLHVGDRTFPSGAASVADIGSTAETVGGAKDDGVAATASRSDHKHEIINPALDALDSPTDITTLNASTGNHGLMIKPVAPAAGLTTIPAIENTETAWKNKALFDTTDPEASGAAAPGTSLIAARRDHVHPAGVGDGDVIGPAGATDGHLALFDGATGKAIKDGGPPAGGGDVSGDAAAVDLHLAIFDGDGYHIADGGVNPLDGWIPASGTWTPRSQAFTNDPAAGSNIELEMVDTSGFEVGDIVNVSSSAGDEDALITVVHANVHITVATLVLNHTTTTPVVRFSSRLPYSNAYTGEPAAGANIELAMANTSGFAVGMLVEVSSSAGRENACVTVVHAGVHITVNTLALNHTTTAPLIRVLCNYTFIIDTSADLSAYITPGTRIKLTDGTVKCFIVVAISTTRITLFGGTDYSIAGASAVTSPAFSNAKSPKDFPLSPTKWTIEIMDAANRSTATPTATQYYNTGSISIVLPIGIWDTEYNAEVNTSDATASQWNHRITLSTTNNSASDSQFTCHGGGGGTVLTWYQVHKRRKVLDIATKTPYYLNICGDQANLDVIYLRGDLSPTIIRAACTYL